MHPLIALLLKLPSAPNTDSQQTPFQVHSEWGTRIRLRIAFLLPFFLSFYSASVLFQPADSTARQPKTLKMSWQHSAIIMACQERRRGAACEKERSSIWS